MGKPDTLDDDAYQSICRLCEEDPDVYISSLQELAPEEPLVEGQAEIFRALANEDRLRILSALRDAEYCVCELQVVLDAPQSTVATHLRKLKQAGLVRSRKKGRWSYYRLADPAIADVLDLSQSIDEHS